MLAITRPTAALAIVRVLAMPLFLLAERAVDHPAAPETAAGRRELHTGPVVRVDQGVGALQVKTHSRTGRQDVAGGEHTEDVAHGAGADLNIRVQVQPRPVRGGGVARVEGGRLGGLRHFQDRHALGRRAGSVEVCTVPSTPAARRRRGYAPVDAMLARCGIRPSPVLRLARERLDQAGLGVEARLANAEGGLEARSPLVGRRFLLVDDVLTTGATLAETRRAVVAAGGSVEALAVLAETPVRRCGHLAGTRETLRDIHGRGDYGGRTGVVDPPFRSG